VEGLIAQRKQHLQQLDDLLKSVFLEMFGDPVRNEKGWEERSCDKVVVNIKAGTSYGGEEKESLDDDEYGVLKISAVTQGYLNPNEFKAVKKAVINKPLRFIKKGDLLFSRANTIELVAACCIVYEDSHTLFLPDKLWALTLDEKINVQYFNYLLKNEGFRNIVCRQASGGHDSMLNISMKKFLSLKIPIPRQSMQNNFAAIVEKIEGIKSRYQASLTDLETLYGALSQKAFKGELDLSRVPLTPDGTAAPAAEPPKTNELQPTTAPFNLPAPSDLATLTSTAGRDALLTQWLTAWLQHLNNTPFSTQPFIEAAQQRLWQLAEDDALELGAADYDQIKAWTSQSLDQGRLAQTYNDVKNRIQLQAVSH
jgi:type I restriction enzyme, S subunit